ncbi:MAG: hypothetical protein WCY68_14505 [Desulfuromonadales bacterium]
MKMICAWCDELIDGEVADTEASHGICPTCQAIHFPDHPPVIADELTSRESGFLALVCALLVVLVALTALDMFHG